MTLKTGLADSGTIQNIPSDSSIDRLPPDILGLIFSYLDWSDLEASVRLNKTMQDRVITAVNFNEPVYMQNFIRVLIGKLNAETFPVQRDLTIGISQNITAQNFSSLPQMQKYILDLKAELIDVLKTLDLEVINHLKDNTQLPRFMEDVFELAILEGRITLANRIPDENSRAWALGRIVQALAEAGNMDRAIEIARVIVREFVRNEAFRDIARVLAQAGKMDRAIEVAGMIFDEDVRAWALEAIVQDLVQSGNIYRAINVARMIVCGPPRSNACFFCLSMLTILVAIQTAHLILKIGSQRS